MDLARTIFVWLFSSQHGARNWLVSRWVFLRAIGLIYFSAFFALLFQVKGLIGVHGLMPAAQFLAGGRNLGLMRFWAAPTMLWISSGNHMLTGLMWAGLLASVLLIADVWPRGMLVVCFVCYLSFVGAGQEFANYQSDGMLLEAGFLTLFLAPPGFLPGWGARWPPMRAAIFLLLWEWFRIYFQSGVVKLASGDPTWRNLTAMYEYYQNGPLPTWIGWYAEQMLPLGFQKFAAGATLFMELVLVWMAFLPRPWRIACGVIVTVWQLGVIATANYAFLNYLVLVLGFLLLDDRALGWLVPKRWKYLLPQQKAGGPALHELLRHDAGSVLSVTSTELHISRKPPPENLPRVLASIRSAVSAILLAWVAYATTVPLVRMFVPELPLPSAPIAALEPFRVANQYGLFAVMTPHRYEIEFQGSSDGQTWTAYRFRYKPQDLHERPRIYAPYQPRFDWNLWFASLGSWVQVHWSRAPRRCCSRTIPTCCACSGQIPFPQVRLGTCVRFCTNTGSARPMRSAVRDCGGGGSFWEPTHRHCSDVPTVSWVSPPRPPSPGLQHRHPEHEDLQGYRIAKSGYSSGTPVYVDLVCWDEEKLWNPALGTFASTRQLVRGRVCFLVWSDRGVWADCRAISTGECTCARAAKPL